MGEDGAIRVSNDNGLRKSEGGCDVGSRGRELNGVDMVESFKNKSSSLMVDNGMVLVTAMTMLV